MCGCTDLRLFIAARRVAGILPGLYRPDEYQGAAIAAAGPVENERVKLTNAPLTIESDALKVALNGMPIVLLNDLEATALRSSAAAPR